MHNEIEDYMIYYNKLKIGIEEIKQRKKDISRRLDLFEKIVTIMEINKEYIIILDSKKMTNLFKSNIKFFEDILIEVFGKDFFLASNKDGSSRFDSDDIQSISRLYGKTYSKFVFEKPNDFSELTLFLKNTIELAYDKQINYINKKDAIEVYNIIEKRIKREFNKTIDTNYIYKNIIKLYQLYINSVDNKKEIVLNSDLKNKIIEYMNVKNFNNKNAYNYGDGFIIMCNEYNKALKDINNEKKDEKIQKKADKYYDKITRKKLEDLENANFPKYSNKDFKCIMNIILNKLSNNILVDDKLVEYYTVLLMYYANYFKTPYYKDLEKEERIIV